jgi:hypothetical protein
LVAALRESQNDIGYGLWLIPLNPHPPLKWILTWPNFYSCVEQKIHRGMDILGHAALYCGG